MSPSVFTIPAGESFVDALAQQLLAESDPLALADMVVLLPTRRACRSLQEGFLRASQGAALILPRLLPLGDTDEEPENDLAEDLPPAIPPLRRQLLLTRLILARGGLTPDQAVRLADELARLIDQVATEELDFARLKDLVPTELADHWQVTLEFLGIITELWPIILAEEGWSEGATRRVAALNRQAARWEANPPDFPVIAAGSTGSQKATARLLTVIARLPKGRLVLPGLDRRLTLEEQRAIDATHPQYSLLRLVQSLGLSPDQVPLWPGCRESRRFYWIAQALRPAATTEDWLSLDPAPARAAFADVLRLDCPGLREEACAIALMMRESLEHPGRRAALVTPDRNLARRVAAELSRFDIEIDDSAGRALAVTPPGGFLALSALMVAQDFAPHATLAALKHPLAQGALAQGHYRRLVRLLERKALRGPRPLPGVAGLVALTQDEPLLRAFLTQLDQLSAALRQAIAADEVPLATLLRAHLQLAEGLASSDAEGGLLWRGDDGRAAFAFMAGLIDEADALRSIAGRHYPALLQRMMEGIVIRPSFGGHPRLAIWGPLEARLQQVDLLILGGLNEGSWPPEPAPDPWMSRPMRQDFGLPPPERRIGLAAHDFAQGICAPRVAITRSIRSDGAPTVPSRWLLRLDALLRRTEWPAGQWLNWACALDQPRQLITPEPPAPRPPFAARPRRLPVTAIEQWMRDPYGLYAKYILRLSALDPIDADPAARDYGSAIHKAMELFIAGQPAGPLKEDARDRLVAIGAEILDGIKARPGLFAFWWPRFLAIADWVIATEHERRPGLRRSFVEIKGETTIDSEAGCFTVTATADRVDRLLDGSLAIIDYKTGAPPTDKEVAAGFAPQLPLEAMIAESGGFAEIGAGSVVELWYWRLQGGEKGGQRRLAGADIRQLIDQARAGLVELVRRFDDCATPYRARPHPDHAPRYSDYAHLARLQEWSGFDAGDGE